MSRRVKKDVTIIGAGPAGITAAVELLKTQQFNVTVVEREASVGGLSKTTEYNGCRFDIGPHHFLTDSEKVLKWWFDFSQNDFLKRNRFTRIFYKKHFFKYPLEPMNVLRGLSIFECFRSIFSYLRYQIVPIKNVKNYQDWLTNRFGYRLFSIFFKTYTEKLWGISCTVLSADWAAQRIKNFSLFKAVYYAFFGRWFKKNKPRTISSEFYYPAKGGAGILWQRAAEFVSSEVGGQVILDEQVVSVEHSDGKIKAILTKKSDLKKTKSNKTQVLTRYDSDLFFSSMSLRELILGMDPLPSAEIIEAAQKLKYRGLITVNLIINKKNICPDHWVYVHEKELLVTRFENMNNFSAHMADQEGHTAITLEYFAYLDESLWKMSDSALIKLGGSELVKMDFIKQADILGGMVLRTSDAYPVYDENYKEHLKVVLDYLSGFKNLILIGRNGTHSYDNMDVTMLSAMQQVDRVIAMETKVVKKERGLSMKV